MEVNFFGFVHLVSLTCAVVVVRLARWRTAAVIGAVFAAVAGTCVFVPWQGYAEERAVGFRASAMVETSHYDGTDPGFHGAPICVLLALACGIMAGLAARGPTAPGRGVRRLALAAGTAFFCAAILTAFDLGFRMDLTRYGSDPYHPEKVGIVDGGIHVCLLGSYLGLSGALAIALRLVGPVVRRKHPTRPQGPPDGPGGA